MPIAILRNRRATVSAALFAALLALAAPSAEARDYRSRGYAEPRYVVAESQWGNGTVSGPVRPGPKGWQVRMPRGTWIDCVRQCSETLRRATIDYWQTVGPNAPDQGPNYFRWEFRY